MDWTKVSDHFAPEGSLRDLYVFETSESDWESLLSALREWPYELTFLVDCEPARLPDTANAVFLQTESASVVLRVQVGKITVCTHFFCAEIVELDIAPGEVDGPTQLAELSHFMRRLGDLLNRAVWLTHENTPEECIAQYSPGSGEFNYSIVGPKFGAA